jgi:nicotinamide riboside transporter PnuC
MIKTILPFITSAMTLLGMWLISEKKYIGWVVGLVNQILWVIFDFMYQAWGLLPLQIILSIIYIRAIIKWRREEISVEDVVWMEE